MDERRGTRSQQKVSKPPHTTETTNYTYLAVGIGSGLAIGAGISLALFDNVALGIGPGLALGTGIGVALDGRKKSKIADE